MIHEDLSSGAKKEAEEQKSAVCVSFDHSSVFETRVFLGSYGSIHSLEDTLRRTAEGGKSIVR